MSTRYAEVYKHLEALVPVPPEVSEFIVTFFFYIIDKI